MTRLIVFLTKRDRAVAHGDVYTPRVGTYGRKVEPVNGLEVAGHLIGWRDVIISVTDTNP